MGSEFVHFARVIDASISGKNDRLQGFTAFVGKTLGLSMATITRIVVAQRRFGRAGAQRPRKSVSGQFDLHNTVTDRSAFEDLNFFFLSYHVGCFAIYVTAVPRCNFWKVSRRMLVPFPLFVGKPT